MNFVASQKTVEDVFTSKKKMVIPRFQRQYVWGKDKLETLWDDIRDNITYDKNKDKLLVTEYFLGSLVLIEKDDSIDRKVIDGQQRLTVFTIFFSAMYDIFHKEGKNDLADSIYGYVVTKNNDGEDVTLLETESPKPFFQSRIQSKNKDPESTPTGKEEERLLDTYNFFIKMLSKENIKIEFNTRFSKETDYIESLKIIRDQILRCKLVYVAVTTIEDAYMIFEVLNGKGEPLSSVDLIKNKIFEVLNNEAPLDKAKTLWNEIKTNIGKEEDLIKFYRNFWLSRYKFTQEKKLYHVFTKQIKKSKSNYNIFLKELKKSSFNYKKIINPSISDWNTNEKTSIYYNLNAFTIFNVTQVRTIILVLLDLYDKNRITLKILKRCLNFLERFHFVFSAICSVIKSSLSQITFLVLGSITFLLANLPTILSYSFSITSPVLSLMNARTTTPFSVPQSSSLTMISCATSTKRLVKYPESAVLRAVSALPLRAPCVDKKNSATDNPSMKFEVIGISTGVPSGLLMIPRIPAN